MGDKIKISIADNNNKTQDLLLEDINKYDDIEVINISSDGELCLEALKELKPDILIMDILLPKVAGFEILDYIKNNYDHNKLIIIIMTALTNDRHIEEIVKYNVEYIIAKPFNTSYLIERVRDLHRTKLSEDADLLKEKIIYDKTYGVITELLINIGIKPNLVGFNYLKTAIYKSYKEINLLSAITKELYPIVANVYETEAASVERSMRHAIEVAWKDKKSVNKAVKFYGYKMRKIRRPTNSKFISVISDYLRSRGTNTNFY